MSCDALFSCQLEDAAHGYKSKEAVKTHEVILCISHQKRSAELSLQTTLRLLRLLSLRTKELIVAASELGAVWCRAARTCQAKVHALGVERA